MDELVKKLRKKEAELDALRRQVEVKQRKRLATLHKELGFGSAEDLITAIRSAGRGTTAGRGRPAASKVSAGGGAAAAGRSTKRSRITPEMRNRIEAALLAGEKGASVARQFGISYPTLHKIKTQVGLVKQRPARGRRKKKA